MLMDAVDRLPRNVGGIEAASDNERSELTDVVPLEGVEAMTRRVHTAARFLGCGLLTCLPVASAPERVHANDDAAAELIAARLVANSATRVEDSDETLPNAARRLLRATQSAKADLPHAAVRDLVAVYVDLEADEQLSASEHKRLKNQVRRRLRRISLALARDLRRQGRRSTAVIGTKSSGSVATNDSSADSRGAGGGAPQNGAQDLIDLIESTIGPDTWDVNGGQGTIRYWQPGMALVVRQTSEVHAQLGGALQNLEP